MTRRYKVLTAEERQRVVERQKSERVTRRQLAEDFGVHEATIGVILKESGTGRGKGNWLPRK